MLSRIKKTGFVIVACLACFSIGRFTGPTKVETKEVEKIVYQERKVQERERNTRETRLPDGTVVKETNTRIHTDTDKSQKSETSSETATTNRPDWRLSGGYQPPIIGFQSTRYTLGIERQLLGEIYAGVSLSSDQTASLIISIGF